MIIKRVKLNPFGGLSNKELTLQKGLNVIVGPNETGKSTIFNAIQKVLFTPAKLGKRRFEKEIKRFLPVSGGDTVQVEMQFVHNDEAFTLRRSWGKTPAAELTLPGGNIITGEDSIAEQLGSLLPASEGTFKSVLMTYQSGLSTTLEELKNDYPDTVQSLGDIIRKTVLETDGVSVDKFKDKIQNLYESYFSRWDSRLNYPENRRGIENPYKKEVGQILESFYNKERIRVTLEKARKYEEELDAVNQKLLQCDKSIEGKETYVKENKKAVDDAKERRTLEAEARALQLKIDTLKKVNSDWPVIENKIRELKNIIPLLEKKLKALQKEKFEADLEEKNKGVREQFKRAEVKKATLNEAEKRLQSVKKLTREDLEKIRNAFTSIEKLKAGITAGKLAIKFTAKRDTALTVQKDMEEDFLQQIKRDESVQFEAGGRLRLKHPDWVIKVSSGEDKIDDMIQEYNQAEKGLRELLNAYGIQSLQQAKELNQKYEQHLNEAKRARENLSSELGSFSYEELQTKIKEIGKEKQTRLPETILEELLNIQNDIENKKKEKEQYQNQVNEYSGKHGSMNRLLDDLTESKKQEKEIKQKSEKLAPLPECIEDIDSFLRQYEATRSELEREKENKNELIMQRAELERDMPGESAEELERRLLEAEEQFQTVIRRGEAVARIRDLTGELLEQMDSGTYRGLEKDLEQSVAVMTDDRYNRIELDSGLPQGFICEDGAPLPYEMLSTGTKDVLAIALRLSMANHFLKDADGCLIMDDPLIDLDPKRQEKASELIKRFAEKKQVVLFTCHPSHAELLEGHQVTL